MLKLRGQLVIRLTLAMVIIAVIAAGCCLYLGTAMRHADIKNSLTKTAVQAAAFVNSESANREEKVSDLIELSYSNLKSRSTELEALIDLSLENQEREPTYHSYLAPFVNEALGRPANLPRPESLTAFLKRGDPELEVVMFSPAANSFYESRRDLKELKLTSGTIAEILPKTFKEQYELIVQGDITYAVLITSLKNNLMQAALVNPLDSKLLSSRDDETVRAVLEKLTYPLALADNGKVIFLNQAAQEILGELTYEKSSSLPKGFLASMSTFKNYEIIALDTAPTADRALITALVFSLAVPLIALIFAVSLLYNFSVPIINALRELLARLKGEIDVKEPLASPIFEFGECARAIGLHDEKLNVEFQKHLSKTLANQERQLRFEHMQSVIDEFDFDDNAKPQSEFVKLTVIKTRGVKLNAGFLNLLRIDQDSIAFFTGDCRRAGERAAMTMAYVTSLTSEYLLLKKNPQEILTLLNDRLLSRGLGGVELIVGILNERTGNFIFANAGCLHNPLICTGAESFEFEGVKGEILGLTAASTYKNLKGTLVQKDRLALFTDGLVDEAEEHSIGLEALEALLLECYDKSSEELYAELARHLEPAQKRAYDQVLIIIQQNSIRF